MDQEGHDVLGVSVQYLDTIAPCSQINLLESGYLFAAGDCSDHFMYRFTSLGADDEHPIISNSTNDFDEIQILKDHSKLSRFCPRSENQNLEITD